MIMCVLLCYPVSIRIYYQQGGLFLVTSSIFSRILDSSYVLGSDYYLKTPSYPLKVKDICNIYTHILNIRDTVYTLSFCFLFNSFFNVQFMK